MKRNIENDKIAEKMSPKQVMTLRGKIKRLLNSVFLALLLVIASKQAFAQNNRAENFRNENYEIVFNQKGISSFISKHDIHKADFTGAGNVLGTVNCKYRAGDGDWLDIYQENTKMIPGKKDSVSYVNDENGTVLHLTRTYIPDDRGVDLHIEICNKMSFPVTIGDLSLVIPWAKPVGEDPSHIFEKTFIKHQFISGNASFLYFTRASGKPPIFLISTKATTSLEFFKSQNNRFNAFVYSGLSSAIDSGGTWRLPSSMLVLNPAGSHGDKVELDFRMEWVDGYDSLRNALYKNGLFDIRVIPGMTLPQGMDARFSLHTKNKIDSIVPEFPTETTIQKLSGPLPDFHLYRVNFNRLGENKLTIYYNNTQTTVLEFFSTEPVETLLKKRSAFLTHKQQHRDTSKWYNGLYSIWDMKKKVLRGPDNTDGFDFWWGYVLTCDDIGLSKAPFIASKNVYFPKDEEIASVEYYIKNFVWGGLQRKDTETPNLYGIYGVPNWREARDPFLSARSRNANLDKMKIYRSYDYPHIIKMYYHMYEIAERYPEKVSYLNAAGYLDRAFNTARAYFTYPYKILPWYETYKWGCYNEMIILPLIDALKEKGRYSDAAWLTDEWEKKVKYFVYDDPYPFRSEYSIDRTAFESSYAFAKYGALHPMKPDHNLWYDVNKEKWYSHPQVEKKDSRDFMERQMLAGLAVRGWVNTAYYTLGSDDSEAGGLSYMARMGGWSILDYGLRFADSSSDWIQLGYASYLSSFALMNTGNEKSNYGYWFPGKENDGAIGWAFNARKYGQIWLQNRFAPRGAWNYDGEADLGMGAITHTASTIITRDPIFDWVGYGTNLETVGEKLFAIPMDGVRIRFAMITNNFRFIVELERDRFAKDRPIGADKKGRSFAFQIENATGEKHITRLKFLVSPASGYKVSVNGHPLTISKNDETGETFVEISVPVEGCLLEFNQINPANR